MTPEEFFTQYAVAEKGLDAMEAAIGPRRKCFSNPGALMIRSATDAIAQSLASMIVDADGLDAAAHEIGRLLLARDTMADWTVEERANLAYESVTRTDHVAMVD
ncbi:hypothetical protein ACFOM8_01820 [Paracoccus angustae]|uniref:Uncharacterized protein n=1 Tax=Paracoccus angustae TaxID=1671480 RepID=A0ABV7TZG4_9RHOB